MSSLGSLRSAFSYLTLKNSHATSCAPAQEIKVFRRLVACRSPPAKGRRRDSRRREKNWWKLGGCIDARFPKWPNIGQMHHLKIVPRAHISQREKHAFFRISVHIFSQCEKWSFFSVYVQNIIILTIYIASYIHIYRNILSTMDTILYR